MMSLDGLYILPAGKCYYLKNMYSLKKQELCLLLLSSGQVDMSAKDQHDCPSSIDR